ncbi:MAG: A/G-specific adenine glycosylase [Leptospiraceae bacterium]|nr:A/G-specific adenine glycosylase [Leptospiraceae bacterium]
MPEAGPIAALARSADLSGLAGWYQEFRRPLPFRRTRHFYPIWISEVMLQQTRVEAMLPKYKRFMAAWPNVQALATAEQESVVMRWQGLGYYSRARNLHRAAQMITTDYNGKFPADYHDAIKLPGVGDYTASAVLSIAMQQPLAVLDGNVKRVLLRLDDRDPTEFYNHARLRRAAQALLEAALRQGIEPGDHNQALMELGALVCLPREPRCHACPLALSCRALASGRDPYSERLKVRPQQPELPVQLYVFALQNAGREYLVIQDPKGLFFKQDFFLPYQVWQDWQLLYQSPGLETLLTQSGPLQARTRFTHAITRYRIDGHCLQGSWHTDAGMLPIFSAVPAQQNPLEPAVTRGSKSVQVRAAVRRDLPALVPSSILQKIGLAGS